MKENVEEKQKELKNWITKIGMTQKYFIGQYCIDNFCSYTEEEIEQYYEKFKKELSRKTTKPEVLDKYFEFLYSLEEFKKIGYIRPTYVEDATLNDVFNLRMNEISKKITDTLNSKYEDY